MDVSRRQLAGIILAGTAVAQAPPPSAAPTTTQPGTELEAARSDQRAAAQIIARIALPMTTEPAFQFKA